MTVMQAIGIFMIVLMILLVISLAIQWGLWVNDKLEYLERRLDNQNAINEQLSRRIKKLKKKMAEKEE